MDNNNNNANLSLEAARALGAAWAKPGMSQAFVVAACKSEIGTAALMDAFNAGKRDAATAELAATGEFEDLPSVKAYRAR